MHNGDIPKGNPFPLNNININKTIKLEPEDLKSDMEDAIDNNNISNDGDELVIDEPEIVIKTEIREINEVSHQLLPSPHAQQQQSHSLNKRIRLTPPTTTATAAATVITNHQNHLSQQPSRTPSLSPDLNILNTGPQYCKTCDITFNYLKTYIAHKKFYCKDMKIADNTNQNGPSPPSAANVVLTRAAETSVL